MFLLGTIVKNWIKACKLSFFNRYMIYPRLSVNCVRLCIGSRGFLGNASGCKVLIFCECYYWLPVIMTEQFVLIWMSSIANNQQITFIAIYKIRLVYKDHKSSVSRQVQMYLSSNILLVVYPASSLTL